jgi:hypothetical protein
VNGPRLIFPSLAAGVLIFGSSLVARPAEAALGETVSAKETRITTIASRPVRYRETDGVREYVGDDGKVFAFTWKGRSAPALTTLLGRYVASYEAGFAHRHFHGHNHLYISTPDLVLSSFVTPRVRFGRAYDPTHLPKGVTVDALP